MSDEEPESEWPAEPTPPAPPAGDHWGDPITPERAAELKALADQQRAWAAATDQQRQMSYFAGAPLTGADVFWLAAYALAGSEGDVVAAQERLRSSNRIELSALHLSALHLEVANLYQAYLERAILDGAHLEGAVLRGAHLERADLGGAHLERAVLSQARLEGALLFGAHLEGANLGDANLERAYLSGAHLAGAKFWGAQLAGAFLDEAHLAGACFWGAQLAGAVLTNAHLEGKTFAPGDADLTRIRQWAENVPDTLPPADLRGAFLSTTTILTGIRLGDAQSGTVQVADVRWGGVNLAVVDWTLFTNRKAVLGDERAARDWKPEPFTETEAQRTRPRRERASARAAYATARNQIQVERFQEAVRANRQLAAVLRDQGMNEEADYFAYRTQVLQRQVLRRQRHMGQYAFSLLLEVTAGYGYRLGNLLLTYVLTLSAFTIAYYVAGVLAGTPLAWPDALLVSFTAIHGRVFLGQFGLHNALSWIAGIEAVAGLVVEGIFVAMLIQRFFGR